MLSATAHMERREAMLLGCELQPGMHVMNVIPVRLDYIADTDEEGDRDYWWVTTTYVEHPETKMMAFQRHAFYKPLHSEPNQ